MATGTLRTIVRSVTVPANTVRAFSQTAGALPTRHCFVDFSCDDPGIDLVAFTVNGLHSRVVNPSDRVCVIFSNSTGSPITANVTVTLSEVDGAQGPG